MTSVESAARKSTILITGGCGFIGGHVVREACRRGYRVVNVDKLTYAASPEALCDLAASNDYLHLHQDICDGAALQEVFAVEQPSAVLHLAAETHVDRSIDSPAGFLQSNIVGTYTLLEAARDYWYALDDKRRAEFRFVQVSTDEVFGTLGDSGAFSENSPYTPNSPYAASKAAADHLARAWQRTFDLPVIITNTCNNYGPFQFPEKLIPLTIVRALMGLSVNLYGDGLQVREWLHVADHAGGLLDVLERGRVGDSYNLGSGEESTNLALACSLCTLLDDLRPDPAGPRERLITLVPDRPGHDRRYAIDSTKARTALGWQSRTALADGLADTVRWYLDHEEWWRRIIGHRYDGSRLGRAAGGQS